MGKFLFFTFAKLTSKFFQESGSAYNQCGSETLNYPVSVFWTILLQVYLGSEMCHGCARAHFWRRYLLRIHSASQIARSVIWTTLSSSTCISEKNDIFKYHNSWNTSFLCTFTHFYLRLAIFCDSALLVLNLIGNRPNSCKKHTCRKRYVSGEY
jgi:hypothetical protein